MLKARGRVCKAEFPFLLLNSNGGILRKQRHQYPLPHSSSSSSAFPWLIWQSRSFYLFLTDLTEQELSSDAPSQPNHVLHKANICLECLLFVVSQEMKPHFPAYYMIYIILYDLDVLCCHSHNFLIVFKRTTVD